MKGITRIELHFEKVILALLTIAMVVLLSLDFLNPISKDMGSKRVYPNQVNLIVNEKAAALNKSQKSSDSVLELQPIIGGVARKNYSEKLKQNLLPNLKITKNAPSFAQQIMNPNVKLSNTWFYEPHFPAADMVSPVAWFSDALEPDASAKNESLQKFLASNSNPNDLDVIWTKPTARVNLKLIRAELVKSDMAASPPQVATPSTWRNNAIYFVDVVFERQEQQQNGSWGETTTVPIMFGFESTTLRNRELKSLDSEKIFAVMRVKASEKEIRQPDFYPTLYKNGGTTPATDATRSTVGGDKKKQQAADKKKADLQAKEKELAPLEKELQAMGGDWTQQKEEVKKADAKAKKDAERKGNDPNKPSGPPVDLKIPQWKKNTKDAIALRKIIKDLQKDLGLESAAPANSQVENAVITPVEADADFIDVWTHDLTATPGKTFRYRCRVDLFNPFFGKERQLVKDQIKLAASPFISSEVSAWSAPVRVPSKVMYFAESGTLGDKGARQVAVFSTYILKNGLWTNLNPSPSFEIGQPLSFSLTAGQSGGDSKAQFEIPTEWFVADIFEDFNAMPEKSRPTLPAVVLGRQDQSGKFVMRYCTQEKLDPDQAILKKLAEDGKNAPAPVKTVP